MVPTRRLAVDVEDKLSHGLQPGTDPSATPAGAQPGRDHGYAAKSYPPGTSAGSIRPARRQPTRSSYVPASATSRPRTGSAYRPGGGDRPSQPSNPQPRTRPVQDDRRNPPPTLLVVLADVQQNVRQRPAHLGRRPLHVVVALLQPFSTAPRRPNTRFAAPRNDRAKRVRRTARNASRGTSCRSPPPGRARGRPGSSSSVSGTRRGRPQAPAEVRPPTTACRSARRGRSLDPRPAPSRLASCCHPVRLTRLVGSLEADKSCATDITADGEIR